MKSCNPCPFLGLLMLAMLSQGCLDAQPDQAGAEVFRLIEESPTELFDPSLLEEFRPVLELSFGHADEIAAWTTVAPLTASSSPGGGLSLNLAKGTNILTRRVDLEASEIEAIRLSGTGLDGLPLRFLWTVAGDDPDLEHSLGVTTRSQDGSKTGTVLFRLGGEPTWRGTITQIGLLMPSVRSHRSTLNELSMGTVRRSEQRIARAADQPWLFDDRGEPMAVIRGGVLSPPGRALHWTVDVPDSALLRFGYGRADHESQAPISFRVLMSSKTGGTPETQELWRQVGGGAWARATVDLTPFAGREITLAFEALASEHADLNTALPAWSNPEIVARGPAGRPSVVLVSVDTLRADRLSLYGYPRPTSPEIDRWAQQHATTFETAVAPSSWTLPSHVSLFTGLNPHRHGVNGQFKMPSGLDTLAERLRREGWDTFAVTGGGFLAPRYGLSEGFDEYVYWNGPGDHAEELESGTRYALSELTQRLEQAEKSGRPYFLFFHTYEVHYPYRARQPFFGQWTRWPEAAEEGWMVTLPKENERLTADRALPTRSYYLQKPGEEEELLPETMSALPGDLYDSGIAFMDLHLSRLLETIEKSGQEDDTMIVITSDHGELLGEHDITGHTTLYEENVRVPLIVSLPGSRSQEDRVKEQVRVVDILPTTLEAVGLAEPTGVDGASLVSLARGSRLPRPREALMYSAAGNHGFGIRFQGVKFILRDSAWPPHRGRRELYRLDEDPRERSPESLESTEAAAFEREVIRRLTVEASGLHIELSNDGPTLIKGTLEGASLTQTLKSVDLRCDCLERVDRDRTRFRVPSGASFSLYSSQLGAGSVRVVLEDLIAGDSEKKTYEAVLAPEELRAPRTVTWDGAEWVETDGREPARGQAFVRISWRGPGRDPASRSSKAEEAANRQLKALGYLQ